MKIITKFITLIVLIIFCPAFNAQIICTDIIPDSVVSIAPGATMQFTTDLDINNDATMDFRINMVQSGSFGFVNVQATQIGTLNSVLANGSNTALALPLGTPITPTSSTWVQMNGSNQQMSIFAAGPPGGSYPGMGDSYLGVRFVVGPSTYYGWIRFNFSNAVNSYTVKDYAYNATPNVSIAAGSSCAAVFAPTFSINSPMCTGNSQTLNANTGTFVASGYTWAAVPAGALFSAPNASVTSITFSNAGTYSVTLSATSGTASGSQINTILINPKPTFSFATTNTLLCGGQTATITASGASTYTWNIGPNTSSIIVTPSLTTSYTVTGTSAAGCTNAAAFTQSVCVQTIYNKMLVKDTTTWQHFGMLLGVKGLQNENVYFNSMAAIDTITIGAYKYKKLYELSTPAYLNYASKMLRGYIREDSAARKIYYKTSLINPEIILYDFNLNLNDSIQLTFPNNPPKNGYYRVDSIVTKTELCGPRKHFYLRKHVNNLSPNFDYFDWIESIGSSYHLLYLYTGSIMPSFLGFPAGCTHEWWIGLACKKNQNNQQFQSCTYPSSWNYYTNSCNYYYFTSYVIERSKINHFSVYPNPGAEKLFIEIKTQESLTVKIELSDIVGKIILSGEQDYDLNKSINTIDINNIDKGIYFIKISSAGDSKILKIIKE